MSGQGDERAARALLQALEQEPRDVLGLFEVVRSRLGSLGVLREGACHAILFREVRGGRVEVRGFSKRGLPLYELPGAVLPDAVEVPPPPEPLQEEIAKAALKVAGGVRDAAARGRIQADVVAHLQDLAERKQGHRFGAVRTARHLLHRVDRGRPTVCLAASPGDVVRRVVLHEGPWMLGAVVIFFLLKMFVLQVYMIPSGSMIPTLRKGDRVVVFYPPGKDAPARWRVVTFELADGNTYVKRLVGLSGERIAILHGDVFVNGERLVKPDDVRAALRSPGPRWDFSRGTPDGWGASRKGEERTWRWQREGFNAHDGARTFALRDGYLELEAERPARGEITLGLARGPGTNDARLEWTLELGVQGLVLRETRYDGKNETGSEVLASGTTAPPKGRVRLDLSFVDGVLRAACGGWSWQGAREAPDEALMPRVSVRREGCRPLALRLDRDLHYSHRGEHGVPDRGSGKLVANPHAIPAGHVFVLGDNTNNSEDSRARAKGDIPVDSLVGPVSFRIWPPSRLGRVR